MLWWIVYALIGITLTGIYHVTDKLTTSKDSSDALLRLFVFIPFWPLVELAEFFEWLRLKLRGRE